jgi:hypothetical protein
VIAYIKKLLGQITALAGAAWSFLTTTWALLTNFKATLTKFVDDGTHLAESCIEEFNGIKNFEFDPKWNTRVISVPRVKENLDQLVAIPIDILTNAKEMVEVCKAKLEPEEFNLDELKFLPEEFGKFLGKALGWIGLVIQCFDAWTTAIADAQHILDDIKKLRTDISNLDGLFLPQTSRKVTKTLTYRKRTT